MSFAPEGTVAWAVNPHDPTQTRRPAIVMWSDDEQALLVFGQSFESGEGPYMTLSSPSPPLRHPTHFYVREFALLLAGDVELTEARLSQQTFESLSELMAADEGRAE